LIRKIHAYPDVAHSPFFWGNIHKGSRKMIQKYSDTGVVDPEGMEIFLDTPSAGISTNIPQRGCVLSLPLHSTFS
jgi:hypothetical protein